MLRTNKARRIARPLTTDELERLKEQRRRIAKELPELIQQNQLRHDARNEATLSGEIRRAIHESPLSLSDIADQIGISTIFLDEFMTGERTLRSDTLDRLVRAIGTKLTLNK